ncbi:hypothetical protein C2W62_15315 [Candidatus Entotheonella serta]|nr:hypothetical protein C2W62_15315 [Candidatus Entotheonella serta]
MSIDWFRLDGKVALVTGAAQGIGQAIAYALASADAKLIISDRQAEKLAQTAAALEQDGREVVYIPADVAKVAEVEAMVRHGLEAYGAIDILVNNAGGSGNIGVDQIDEISDELWEEIIDINMKSAFFCCRAGGASYGATTTGKHHQFLVHVSQRRVWASGNISCTPALCWGESGYYRADVTTGQRPGAVGYPGQYDFAGLYPNATGCPGGPALL